MRCDEQAGQGGERRCERALSALVGFRIQPRRRGPQWPRSRPSHSTRRGPQPAPAVNGSTKTGRVSGCPLWLWPGQETVFDAGPSHVLASRSGPGQRLRPPTLAVHTNAVSFALLTRRADRPSPSASHTAAARQPRACPRYFSFHRPLAPVACHVCSNASAAYAFRRLPVVAAPYAKLHCASGSWRPLRLCTREPATIIAGW